ncbi:MAG: DUF2764 domain-containing protein [Treponema sp.]|nr:DUF2764 domain-containing protein [Treponema sp.]
MKNYYYFVASLPWISWGDPPPVSSREFREQCRGLIEPGDAALTEYCRYDPRMILAAVRPTGSDFIDLLMARERALILNLAYLRATRLKRPSPGEPPHDVPQAEAAAKAACEMDDPLQAELYLDRSRWDALDTMVGVDYFGVNNIFAYLMKLQLLERRQLFDTERGFAGYTNRYDAIVNDYNSISKT